MPSNKRGGKLFRCPKGHQFVLDAVIYEPGEFCPYCFADWLKTSFPIFKVKDD